MNVALGIGALLLGGWVLNAPSEDLPSGSPESVLAPSGDSARGSKDAKRATSKDETQGKKGDRGTSQGQKSRTSGSDAQPSRRGQTNEPLPGAPTEPGRAQTGSKYLMPTPPTGLGRDAEYNAPSGYANPSGSPMTPLFPEVPTSRRVESPRNMFSPSYYNFAEERRRVVTDSRFHSAQQFPDSTTAPTSSFAMPAVPDKAFSGSQPFSSGVSPYMGLFRNDTAGGTIDNYTTFVRPMLDQRGMNQQFNLDIYGLQRSARLQQSAMRQMERNNTRTLQGVGTPEFYMNFGNYYPGLGPMSPGYGQ
jgi:hypothetical protein